MLFEIFWKLAGPGTPTEYSEKCAQEIGWQSTETAVAGRDCVRRWSNRNMLKPWVSWWSLPRGIAPGRVGSTRLGQKDGTARPSGRFRRTDPPALETDPPSTTNAYSGAAIRRLFGLVWFDLFFQTNSCVLLPLNTRLWY